MGTYNKYSIDEVHYGDLIYFDGSLHQNNYDAYWEVCDKNLLTGEVQIKLYHMYENHLLTVHCSEIRQLLSAKKVQKVG